MTEQDLEQVLALGKKTIMSYAHDVLESGNSKWLYQRIDDEVGMKHLSILLHGMKLRATKCWNRSQIKGFDFDLDMEDLTGLWIRQRGRCVITGIPMSFETSSDRNPRSCSVDRIRSDGGYTLNNIRLCSFWANNAMNAWGRDLLEEMIVNSVRNLNLV